MRFRILIAGGMDLDRKKTSPFSRAGWVEEVTFLKDQGRRFTARDCLIALVILR